MATSPFGWTAAPHPTDKDIFSITNAGTGGTFVIDAYLPGGVVTSTAIAYNASAANVETALENGGNDWVESVSGGALATAPVVVTARRSWAPVTLVVKTNSVTGGAGPTITKTQTAPQRANNKFVRADGAGTTVTTTNAPWPDGTPQYGQTPYSPDPSGIASATTAAQSANALTGAKSNNSGHTARSAGQKPIGFKGVK